MNLNITGKYLTKELINPRELDMSFLNLQWTHENKLSTEEIDYRVRNIMLLVKMYDPISVTIRKNSELTSKLVTELKYNGVLVVNE